LWDTCESGDNGLGDRGTEAVLPDARRHNVTDAKFRLERIDIYVECREIFVTINEAQDGAMRLTKVVNIFELFLK